MQRVEAIGQTLTKGLKANFCKATPLGKAPKIENIKKGWDSWALKYAMDIEPNSYPSQVSILREIAPGPNCSILEAACGSGYFGAMHCLNKPETQKYTMVDLSPKMVEIARKRVFLTLQNKRFFQQVDKLPEIEEEAIEKVLRQHNITILDTDCEHLNRFESNSFDVYLGGLFIHLVPEPLNVLKEAYRVVKPGGSIGFSVFGDPEKSLYFNLFDNIVKKEGHIEYRSKFYLADEAMLRQLVTEAGFKRFRTMRQDLSFGVKRPEEADDHFEMPSNKAILKKFDKTKVESMKSELRSLYKTALQDRVIGIQNLLVVATK
jgi:ubiquinone/menaquinone biosynthesis C-methylase UbiE